MPFWSWLRQQWCEADEFLSRVSRLSARMVERMRQLRTNAPYTQTRLPDHILLKRCRRGTRPHARRRRYQRLLLLEDITEEDDPDHTS